MFPHCSTCYRGGMDLADQLQLAFDRCKEFPEAGIHGGMFLVRGDAYLALLELRNLMPDAIAVLRQLSKQREGCREIAQGEQRSDCPSL